MHQSSLRETNTEPSWSKVWGFKLSRDCNTVGICYNELRRTRRAVRITYENRGRRAGGDKHCMCQSVSKEETLTAGLSTSSPGIWYPGEWIAEDFRVLGQAGLIDQLMRHVDLFFLDPQPYRAWIGKAELGQEGQMGGLTEVVFSCSHSTPSLTRRV